MSLAPYTTPALIRVALGINAQDLGDTKIDVSIHLTHLREALRAVSATLPEDLRAVLALSDPTPDETRLRDLGEMVCTYSVAHLLTATAPLFAPQVVKDDRTSVSRVADPFKNLRKELGDTLAYITAKLRGAYLEAFPEAVVNSIYAQPRTSAAVGLGTDPVTG